MNSVAAKRESMLREVKEQFGVGLVHLPEVRLAWHVENVAAYVPNAATRHIDDYTFQAMRTWFKERDWQLSRQPIPDRTQPNRYRPYLFLAPIVFVSFDIGYHCTRRACLPMIMWQGLLPSSPDRQNDAKRKDCEGSIYVCEHLGSPQDAGVKDSLSAHWWRDHLSKNNSFDDPDWVVLEITLSGLPPHRLYRDIWSQSGVIVDGVDRIPPELITLIYDGMSLP